MGDKTEQNITISGSSGISFGDVNLNVGSDSSSQKKTEIKKILFLACNPSETGQLRLDREIREVEEGLRRSKHRDRFQLLTRLAVRPADFSRAMLDEEPCIVHFSGHGVTNAELPERASGHHGFKPLSEKREASVQSGGTVLESQSGGIVLENSRGEMAVVPARVLGNLMEPFCGQVECVFLNACYSESQADAFLQYVPYVVGMNAAVPDDSAIALAVGFYDAIGAGKDLEDAFKIAVNRIELEALPGAEIPVLRKRDEDSW